MSEWTKEKIQSLLNEDSLKGNIALERALVHLYNRQTEDERESETTKYPNGKGFNGQDAMFMSSLAEQVIQSDREPGFRLSPKQREALRRTLPRGRSSRIGKYAGQLLLVIKEKEST